MTISKSVSSCTFVACTAMIVEYHQCKYISIEVEFTLFFKFRTVLAIFVAGHRSNTLDNQCGATITDSGASHYL